MRLVLAALLALLAGCDGCVDRTCIKSHEEPDQCMYYMYVYGPNMEIISMIPIYYDCTTTVCDVYQEQVK